MTDRDIAEAYSDWAWNKEGDPIGYYLPHQAARIAFFAGVKWALARQVAPPSSEIA